MDIDLRKESVVLDLRLSERRAVGGNDDKLSYEMSHSGRSIPLPERRVFKTLL